MDQQGIVSALEVIVQERSGLRSSIAPDARFKEDLEIDSLLVVDIIVDIEKKFGISLPDDQIVHVSTLSTASALVDRLISASAS